MHILEVVKYEGDNSTFIWKHPCEDFNTNSQLIVHEGQQALVLVDGTASEPMGPGSYTMDTKNLPVIRHIVGLATGGVSPFHCEVYFITTAVQMALKWGTDSKVRYVDPDSGLPLGLGACGEMNLRVSDGKKLLEKLVGTTNGIAWGDTGAGFSKSVQNCFRPMISTAVKSNLTAAIKEKQVDLFEVDEHLAELSEALKTKVEPGFAAYGLSMPEFYLTTVVLPEDDPNFKRLRELRTITLQTRMARAEATVETARAQAKADIEAARRVAELEKQTTATEVTRREAERTVLTAQAEAEAKRMSGLAEAEIMRAKGYSEKDVLEAEVQKAYAEGIGRFGSNAGAGGVSGGSSGMAGDMVSMMAGMKMAGMVMDKMDGVFGSMSGKKQEPAAPEKPAEQKCPSCGASLPENAKFCLSCGAKTEPPVPEGMVICPSCGKLVAKGKFCLECGFRFVSVCPSCGKELPAGAKFCLECGAKI